MLLPVSPETTVLAKRTDTQESAHVRVCPLDGGPVEYCADNFLVCLHCWEMLTEEETVLTATPETWAAYLLVGSTDTDPVDAPLKKLLR